MKKSAIFAAAFVLTLGLAQCKKEQPNAQNIEGETVHITLNVNNNGSRADVNTSTGHITFNDNDKLYVGYDNAYVGTLAYSASTSKFSGEINLTQSGEQPLHFYYLGGGDATQVGETQQYTVDISDQTSNYPVISYGTSTQNYSASLNSYTTTLLNQCALVEFTTNEIPTTTAVSISGMKNKVTVDFNGNTLTPSEERGTIKLHAESPTSRWAILLSDNAVTTTATAEGYNESDNFTVPSVAINGYLHGETAISFTLTEAAATIINLANVNSDITVENGAILTGTLGANVNVKISIAAGATVTLDGVNITNLGNNCDWAGINCPGDATIILKDGSTNTVCAGRDRDDFNNYPGIWIAPDKKLTIKGGGQLTAYSNDTNPYGAGIGGGFGISCGNIEIQGGDITATGGGSAAGIGSGQGGICGTITISGGTVTATGGELAAGIGSGYGNYTSCVAITITGGTVTATGDYGAAGIGSGYYASCGAITISGGTVTATGVGGAAGIGSGKYASCGAITISGGTVTATGGEWAAGIGSGTEASCGDITITTGVTSVTATKGEDTPNSIGAGDEGTCGTVTIGGVETGFITQSPYTYVP